MRSSGSATIRPRSDTRRSAPRSTAFFASIHSSHHDILNNWEPAGHLVSQGMVTYTRLDGRKVTVPFVNIFNMQGKLVQDYLIYIDNTPLYAPAA